MNSLTVKKPEILKALFKESYRNTFKDVSFYSIDKQLSDRYVKVYRNQRNGEVVVVHRGTSLSCAHDIIADLGLLFRSYNTFRFRHAANKQRLAERKYGAKNIITIGHSLGGAIAKKVGKNSKERITLNRPFHLNESNSDTEQDIRSELDPVSLLAKFKKNKNLITIPSTTCDLLKEHSYEVLDRISNSETNLD
ncbi:MAG: hypothetical protein KGJ07_10215 [Patescibacteria group bacterium]|nr:hypothetical protein [Patescibacteria group bacterium]